LFGNIFASSASSLGETSSPNNHGEELVIVWEYLLMHPGRTTRSVLQIFPNIPQIFPWGIFGEYWGIFSLINLPVNDSRFR